MDLKCWHRIFKTALWTWISLSVSSPTTNVKSEVDGSSNAAFKESNTESSVKNKCCTLLHSYIKQQLYAFLNIFSYLFWARTWMNFCNHWYMSYARSCEASKDLVNGCKGSFSWAYYWLAVALSPHITFAGLLSDRSTVEFVKHKTMK